MTSPEPAKPPKPPKRRPKGRGAGYAIGAFIVEIDQRLLRNIPPTEVLVAKGEALRGLSGEAGAAATERITIGDLIVELPARDGVAAGPVTDPEHSAEADA